VLPRTSSHAGYRQLNETGGALVTYQHHFVLAERRGIGLVIDLHWKLNNPQIFADVLFLRSYPTLERLGLGANVRA
jgi:hypothetical protein